jgi:hypothetical protein
VRGVVPAWTQVATDFPNYYTAGRIVAAGDTTGRLYDDDWFQGRIRAVGLTQQGKFSPFPPETALLFVPLALLQPLDALRLMTVFSLVLLGVCVVTLSRLFGIRPSHAATFVLLSGLGLWNCLRFGQLYIDVSACCIIGYCFFVRKNPLVSGFFFGLLLPVKYYPLVFVLHFLLLREWRVVVAALVTALAVEGAGILVMGWDIHRQFLFSVLPQHLGSDFSGQDPFASAFQSWDSFFRRLFVFDAARNPHPFLAAPAAYTLTKAVVVVSLAASAVGSLVVLLRRRSPRINDCSPAILGILALLIAPGTATYHYVLLWLPCGLLLNALRKHGQWKLFTAVLTLYAVIGFIPYRLFSNIATGPLLGFMAYPRLFIVLALFILALATAHTAVDERRHPSQVSLQ